MPPKKNAQSTAAEISLVRLENCLVNLPSSLVSLLVNLNTVSTRSNYHQLGSADADAPGCRCTGLSLGPFD